MSEPNIMAAIVQTLERTEYQIIELEALSRLTEKQRYNLHLLRTQRDKLIKEYDAK